jgi:biotin-(acetyl-CoA carboxylase) ligase
MLGKRVAVSSAAATIAGTAEDVSRSGALMLRLDTGELREIVAGDVSLREA